MKLIEAITNAMTELAKDPKVVFIGYNVKYGRAGGTLAGVSEGQLIEMPVAENLMVGHAMGMSLEGYKPVVCFERMDFMMNAMDAIVNHLVPAEKISGLEFSPKVLIRAVAGKRRAPLRTGITHTGNYCLLEFGMYSAEVKGDNSEKWVSDIYKTCYGRVVIEHADDYQMELER